MIIQDSEFGEIIVRRSSLARGASFSVSMNGRLQMTIPTFAKPFLIKRFLEASRQDIREKLDVKDPATQRARDLKKKILMKKAKEYLPYRLEYFAKLYGYHYDNFRLSHARTRWGSCTHHHLFLSSASTRSTRNSRSSRTASPDHHSESALSDTTTISLNIGLMQVPEILRDYVIIHELAHLNHPDHSPAFWEEVGSHDPRYKEHRKKLKMFSPEV